MPFPSILVANDNTDECLLTLEAWEEQGIGDCLQFAKTFADLYNLLTPRGHWPVSFSRSSRPWTILLDARILPDGGTHSLAILHAALHANDVCYVLLDPSSPRVSDPDRVVASRPFILIPKPGDPSAYLQLMKELCHAYMKAHALTGNDLFKIFPCCSEQRDNPHT
ncbi:MAG: hypothetical protein D6704_06570 [Nitrospirae bacterium]|nr:MAG: hypothetical protein D6704_06570 [Nitrospirota bacterium]